MGKLRLVDDYRGKTYIMCDNQVITNIRDFRVSRMPSGHVKVVVSFFADEDLMKSPEVPEGYMIKLIPVYGIQRMNEMEST